LKRHFSIVLALLFLLQAATTFATNNGEHAPIAGSGIIEAKTFTVTAPRIAPPRVLVPLDSFAKTKDPDGDASVEAAVSAEVSATTLASGSASAGPARPATATVSPAGTILAVCVREGDRVRKGDLVAKIDDRLLRLAFYRQIALRSQAKARVLAVDSRIASVEHRQRQVEAGLDEIEENKRELARGKRRLAAARAELDRGFARLRNVEAQLDGRSRGLAELSLLPMTASAPATTATPPGTAPPRAVPDPVTMQRRLAAARAELRRARARLEAGAAMLGRRQARLASAEVQLKRAESRLERAREALSEARGVLATIRRLSAANATAAEVAVNSARVELGKAVLTAPASGTVTGVNARAGEVAFSNQPLVTISQMDLLELVIYLPPDAVRPIQAGDGARISIDTFAGRTFLATVKLVGSKVELAPSDITTERVYLTEVQAVTLTAANKDGALKPGMPADAEIDPR